MLNYMDYISTHDHEQLVLCHDRESGLRALIGIHNTLLGPSLGGVRLWQYASDEAAALDVLRLSEGMTYKAAIAGLDLGGGKTVIMADGAEDDPAVRSARFRALGRFIEGLGGRYIGAEDVGTKPNDMIDIRQETAYVAGLPLERGGSGDPSPVTAYGVFRGIQALVEMLYNTSDLSGMRVAVQGLGKVGMALADHLLDAGAVVIGADVNLDSVLVAHTKGVKVVEPHQIYDQVCEIFAPCALGASINDNTLMRLKCKIVAGAANNQLAEEHHAEALRELGIVYAVDYVINAGGLINVAQEVSGAYDAEAAYAKASNIYNTVTQMLTLAEAQGITTLEASQQMAQARLEAARERQLQPA